jgi:hypothetical protein
MHPPAPIATDFRTAAQTGGIMEQVGRYDLTDSSLANKAAAISNALRHIAQRVLGILALLAFTYGLLAAEVELAKLEQFTAPPHADPVQHVRDHW